MSGVALPTIRVLGPREIRRVERGTLVIDTTSHSRSEWSSGLSPFHLGPCPLYGGRSVRVMENAWQATKVYHEHLDADGNPGPAYWRWAEPVWAASRPMRYPMGKGVKPAYAWWDGRKLPYVEARLSVYWPLYRDAVAKTQAFAELKKQVAELGPDDEIVLFDFDGFDHEAMGLSLGQVLTQEQRSMGHGFVLKAMLEMGEGVVAEDVLRGDVSGQVPVSTGVVRQGRLF